jgi:hypothetical protein
MTDEELVSCFEGGTVPPGGFHHAEHVRVAWWYARRHPWLVALDRFRVALRRFAEAQGKPGLYHETITTAFVVLVVERLDGDGADLDWESFRRAQRGSAGVEAFDPGSLLPPGDARVRSCAAAVRTAGSVDAGMINRHERAVSGQNPVTPVISSKRGISPASAGLASAVL